MKGLDRVRKNIEQAARTCGRDPADITLVVVSKGRPVEAILQAYEAGARDFGENRVKALLEKIAACPKDIRWHFIGTLQRKKVKEIIGKCHLIHSVDSVPLAQEIAKRSVAAGLTTSCLIEANVSQEASKHGLSSQEWKLQYPDVKDLAGIEIQGLMTMAPLTDDAKEVRNCFKGLRVLREQLGDSQLRHLSMGMTQDYQLAIEEGATMVRVGTAIFEEDL